MLKDEATGAAPQRACDAFDCNVAGGTLDWRECREHFAFACADKVTFEALVKRHSAEVHSVGSAALGLRLHLDGERTLCYGRHANSSLCPSALQRRSGKYAGRHEQAKYSPTSHG